LLLRGANPAKRGLLLNKNCENMRNKKLMMCTLLILTFSCRYDKENEQLQEIDYFYEEDFPTVEMYLFLKDDIQWQTGCDCVNFTYDENLLDQNQAFIFLSNWEDEIFDKHKLNLKEEKYVIKAPPYPWITQKKYNKCLTVYVPNIVTTENNNLFFAELNVQGREKQYLFLALRTKENVWIRQIIGNIMTDEELEKITIKL
jgi:hypothetical protein